MRSSQELGGLEPKWPRKDTLRQVRMHSATTLRCLAILSHTFANPSAHRVHSSCRTLALIMKTLSQNLSLAHVHLHARHPPAPAPWPFSHTSASNVSHTNPRSSKYSQTTNPNLMSYTCTVHEHTLAQQLSCSCAPARSASPCAMFAGLCLI